MRGIIFDLDGTLFDSEPVHGEAIREALAPLGLDVEDEWYVGLPDRDAIERAFAEAGRPDDDSVIQAVVREKSRRYRAKIAGGRLRPYEGALEFLEAAAKLTRVGLCTAAPRADAMSTIDAAGVTPLFRVTVCSEDVERSKPDPACYRLCTSRLEVDAAQCIVIEDSVHGVASAKGAGLRVIAVGHTMSRESLHRADMHVEHIRELSIARVLSMM